MIKNNYALSKDLKNTHTLIGGRDITTRSCKSSLSFVFQTCTYKTSIVSQCIIYQKIIVPFQSLYISKESNKHHFFFEKIKINQ